MDGGQNHEQESYHSTSTHRYYLDFSRPNTNETEQNKKKRRLLVT